MEVLVVPEADLQIRAIEDWWRENRLAAPALFAEEMAGSFELIASPRGSVAGATIESCPTSDACRCAQRATTSTPTTPSTTKTKTKVRELRKQFADELGEALTNAGVGLLLGTATGPAKGYYDVLLFDFAAARPVLERVARANALVQSATVVSFSPVDPKEMQLLT